MKPFTILLLLLMGLMASCTGQKKEKTTPEPAAGTGTGGPTDPGTAREATPAGPSSDLCTDDQCPGQVR
jgi:hypothetical protein